VISPEHVKVARLIKYMFTGNLNHKFTSYPVFPGLEKHLVILISQEISLFSKKNS